VTVVDPDGIADKDSVQRHAAVVDALVEGVFLQTSSGTGNLESRD
jgi:hypothetical protein